MSGSHSGRRSGQGWTARLLGAAVAALFALVCASTSPTLSAWTTGVVVDQTNNGAVASLAFGHSAGSCSQAVRVTGVTTCPGSPVGTDTITNSGTAVPARLAQTVSASSCAPAQLADARSTTRPMLPRSGVGFGISDPWNGTSAVRFDGTGYAAAVTRDQRAPNIGQTYGVGVWFRSTGTTQYGPLFSLDTSAVNATTAGGDDRTMYLAASGRLTFYFATLAGMTVTSTAAFNDGSWHFAYVTLAQGALTTTTTLYVDGAQAAAPVTGILSAYTNVNGYWHLGWGSTSLTGVGTTPYFSGALSNFVVFNTAAAPTGPSLSRASQAAFTTWAGTATDYWLLGDSGLTPFAGTTPISPALPCDSLAIDWTFTNPTATAASGAVLSTFANGTDYLVTAPGPGVAQTSTLTITRRASPDCNSYVTGLRLVVPFRHKVSLGGTWTQTFSWNSLDAVVIAP